MADQLPPDLMALLGGGGAPDPSAAPAGPDAAAQGPVDPSQDPASVPAQDGSPDGDPVEILTQMIDLAMKYLDVEPDEEDKSTMTKVLQQLQQYKAKDQADADAALGGKVSPKLMRKVGSGSAA